MTDNTETTAPAPRVQLAIPRDLRDRLRWLAANATKDRRGRVTMVDLLREHVERLEGEQSKDGEQA